VGIAENRILRTAIRRMLAVPRLANSAAARLAHLDGRLAEVSVLRHGATLPVWHPTRLNEQYVPALRLAELVLANTAAEAGDGTVQLAGFVVDMAKVFEDFVGTPNTEALRRYSNADRYQMLAYCTALKVPTAWLVYAGGGKTRVRRIRHTGVEVVEHPLDLRAEPQALLEQVALLAREAWEWSLRGHSAA
jgi:5-methylcytosine-specific restriction enzyme subunit McrC